MIDEKKIIGELPEPIDLKMELPPEIKKIEKKAKKDKKSKEKDELIMAPKKLSLEELIEKNIKWSQAIYLQNKKIKRSLNMMTLANYLKLIFIIGPLILAIIYLPPLLDKYMSQFNDIFGVNTGGIGINDVIKGGFNLDSIFSQLSPEDLNKVQGVINK